MKQGGCGGQEDDNDLGLELVRLHDLAVVIQQLRSMEQGRGQSPPWTGQRETLPTLPEVQYDRSRRQVDSCTTPLDPSACC